MVREPGVCEDLGYCQPLRWVFLQDVLDEVAEFYDRFPPILSYLEGEIDVVYCEWMG